MRSLELLGLAGFNMFLGLTLTVTFLSQGGDKKTSRLSEASVSAFISEMTDVALGKKPELDQYAVTMWLMDHVAEDSSFLTNVNILQASGQTQTQKLQMNRMDYISQVLKDSKAALSREASVHVEYVKIEEGGKDASVVFTSVERANIAMKSEAGDYEIPVTGTSYCEQKLKLQDKIIKVSASTCTSNISMAQGF